MNADDFRKYRLYNARVHKVLAAYHGKLRKVFNAYVGLKKASVERRSRMFLDEFMRMLFDAQLFDEVRGVRTCVSPGVRREGVLCSRVRLGAVSLQRFAKREARVCFTWARMRVVDDLRHRDLFCSLGFMGERRPKTGNLAHAPASNHASCHPSTDFMEALARISDMVTLPAVADLRSAGVTSAYEFFLKSRRSGIRSETRCLGCC